MKREQIAPEEFYHVFNRGVGKQIIFHDTRDYQRFLFLILYFQSPITFSQVGRAIRDFVKHPVLDNLEEVVRRRTVELISFCVMPNHFHLIIRELEDGGIASYMQRILNAYSKYYNTKYQKSGHVFQGPYKIVHIQNDRQLLYLSAYIHRNPRELPNWRNKEDKYQWSSLQDIIHKNRWGKLLLPGVLLGEFKNSEGYHSFIKASPTKLSKEELAYWSNL